MATADQVQEVYIAYYGRPADSEGLAFWVSQLESSGGDLEGIIEAFGESDEFNERFGNDDTETLINNIYQNLFGRDADAEGLAFYSGLLDSGEASLASIALRVLDGAQNDDALDVAAKVAAANLFTAAAGPEYAGSEAANAANAWLATVNRDSDLVEIENNIADIVRDVLPEVPGVPGDLFTLTELPSQTETTLLVGNNGVPAEMALEFLQQVAELDLIALGLLGEDGSLQRSIASIEIQDNTDGTAQIIINAGDDVLDAYYYGTGGLALIADVLFGNYLDLDETTTQTGIVLTPTANNGGSFESGFTTADDDLIVAGRPELLHGAYIDGGAGYNTLEVDMKGFFAQPLQLLNIQEVQVQNLANVYDVNQTIIDGADLTFPIPSDDYLTGEDSILDLSRASSLEKLVITEGFTAGGSLTVAGIQNYATARLEGNFAEDVDLFYGRGQGDLLTVELANVSFDDTFSVNQNVGAVELVSEGRVNTLNNVDFGGNFVELIVSGTGLLSIEDSLEFGFGEALIDASANTGGIRLNVSSQDEFGALEEITIIGSQARDIIALDGEASVANGALVNIDTGAGRDTLKIDTAFAPGEGSVITGEDLTVQVNANADLRNADVNGVNSFVIAATGGLLLTQMQVEALGAGAFAAAHNDIPVLSVEVSEAGTVLADLIDLSALDSDVKLAINVKAGASLELTAEELHTYLAEDGVVGEGTLTITDAGLGFNIDDASGAIGDGVGTVGTIDADGTVIVERAADGFERPVAAPDSDTLIIDTTGTGGVEVDANNISDDDAFSTAATTVIITGDDDVTFNVPVEMTSADFTLDFSGLTGALNNLTIRDFQNVEEVIGNGAGVRIDVELAGDVGEEGRDSGLISSGVQQYVVTDLVEVDEDSDHTFHLCDNTRGVEVIGLQGNAGDTLTFTNVPWGAVNPTILFEGDGYGNWDQLPKAAGNPDESNVGTIVAEYFFDGAPANVLITNQGVAPGLTSTGEPRPIVVDGIEVDNAASLSVTVEDGNAVISSIADSGSGAGLDDVTLASAFDVTLHLDGDDLDSIDATAVDGVATLHIEASTDFSDTELSGIDAVVLEDGVVVTMTIDQITSIGADNLSVENEGDTATLNVGNYDGQAFDFGALGLEGIEVGTVTTIEGVVTVDAATDFTGISELIIPAEANVTISAAQFKQLVDSEATISTPTSGDNTGSLTVDLDGDLTIGEDDETTIDGANVTFAMADGEVLNVETFSLADGLQVSGDAAAATKPLVNFTFDTDADPATRFNETIDVAAYQDVDLRILDALLNNFWIDANNNATEDAGENSQSIEDLLDNLESANILNIYQEAVVAPTLDPRDREVVVEPGAEPDGIEFSAEGALADYVRSIDLTLQANADDAATINGDIFVNDGQVLAGFTMLTINTADLDGAATGPVSINGGISSDSDAAGDAGDLVDITINADVDLNITGDVVFSSTAAALDTATLTLTGDADVTIKELEAGANITTIDVDSTDFTGTLDVTGGSPALSGGIETLNLEGMGDVIIGTPVVEAAEGVDLGGEIYSWGSTAPALATVNATGQSGALTLVLGAVAPAGFSFTGGSGVNTLWLSNVLTNPANVNPDGELTTASPDVISPELSAGANWSLDLSGSAAGSVIRLTDAVGLNGDADSSIDVDLGADGELQLDGDFDFFFEGGTDDVGSLSISGGTLNINGNVDFRGLVDGDDLNLDLDGVTIFLEAGGSVQMTDAQFAAFEAAGGSITGPGTTLLVDADLVGDVGGDLTDVRGLTELQLVAQDDEGLGGRQVADPLTLTFEQAELTTQYYYDGDGVFGVLPVDGNGAFDADGDPAEAGDFRGFAQDVTVEVSSDADLTGLQGVTTFDLPADTEAADLNDVALTARADQVAALSTDADVDDPADGAGDPGDILAQLSSLSVLVQVDTGNTDIEGNPIVVESVVNFTYDAGEEEWNVTGNAAAIGEAQKITEFDELLNEAASVTWTAVGSTASMTLEPLDTADLTAAAGDDTFVFAANVDTDPTSSLVITNFGVSGTDLLDLSALEGASGALIESLDTGDGTSFALTADAIYLFAASTDLTAAEVANDINTADPDGVTELAPGESAHFLATFGGETAIFQYTEADTADVQGSELVLIGTVDNAALTAADISVA